VYWVLFLVAGTYIVRVNEDIAVNEVIATVSAYPGANIKYDKIEGSGTGWTYFVVSITFDKHVLQLKMIALQHYLTHNRFCCLGLVLNL